MTAVRATPIPGDRALSPFGRARLVGEIVVTYVSARRKLRHTDLAQTLAALRGHNPQPRPQPAGARALGLRLGAATSRTLAVFPTDSRCLTQSLVLTRLLARRNVDTTLVLAVRPGETLAAHAWIEHDGQPLLEPGYPPLERLVEL